MQQMLMKCLKSFLCLLILSRCATLAHSAEINLFQIGKKDNASLEFNSKWDFAQQGDPDFLVGKGTPSKDWSGFHPAPWDSSAGERTHAFSIRFSLADKPKGTFTLTLHIMFRHAPFPQYLVEVNGKKGRFYFGPDLTYEIGDPDTAWNSMFSVQELKIPLPASHFRVGENRIVLSCIDEAGKAHFLKGEGFGGFGIYYDAIGLSNDPTAAFSSTGVLGQAKSTVFYRQGSAGQLFELISLSVRVDRPFRKGNLTLTLESGKFDCALSSPYDFGETQCQVEIPEFSGSFQVKLSAQLDGKTKSFATTLVPQRKWKLFEVPHYHLDPGYTDYRPPAYEVHSRNMDQVVEALEAHSDYRYNPDGSWIMEDYWAHRDSTWQQRFVKLLQEHKIEMPIQYAIMNTGLLSQEEMNRLGYCSANFSRQYGFPISFANLTDPPGHSWAVPSVLSAMGLRYLAVASNQWRGPIILHGRLNEKSPFWWEGPDGSRVLTWYSRHYHQAPNLFGQAPVLQAGIDSLPVFLQPYERSQYAPDAVMLFGTGGDNEPFATDARQLSFVETWNKEFAFPKIIISSMPEFFRYIEKYSTSFPTLRGDGGAWWEEMSASDALYSGMARQAKQRIVAGEIVASLGVLVNRNFAFPYTEDREVWQNLLMWTEHTWGYVRAWIHPESHWVEHTLRSKQSYPERAQMGADSMARRGLAQLADKIPMQEDTLVVFNSLSWKRGGLVEAEIPRGLGVVDLKTHRPVALELLRRVDEEDYDLVRFWAEDIPPVGYRCYTISGPSNAQSAESVSRSDPGTIENAFFRVVVDPARGGLSSLYDKQLGKELLDASSAFAFNQFVHVSSEFEGVSLIKQRTDLNTSLLQYSTALPRPKLKISGATDNHILAVRKAPWGTVVQLQSSAAHTPQILAEIRLFDALKRIGIRNLVKKEVVKSPEAAYFAFPLAGQPPVVRYEIQNAWVDPMRDQLPGANREWYAAQHWVSVSSPGASVGLALDEAPLFTIGDVVRGLWPADLEIENGSVFSYVMNNYDGDDERPYQAGEFIFHYALNSQPNFDPVALARLGREEANPLEVLNVVMRRLYHQRLETRDAGPGTLDPAESSFLQIEDEGIALSAWKAAEDGQGYVLRFYNTTDKPIESRVFFPHFGHEKIYRCNAVEVNQQEVKSEQDSVRLSLKSHEIQSLRVVGIKYKSKG